jgi:hypothetical protein
VNDPWQQDGGGPVPEEGTVTYGVTVQTLDRQGGNGVTMLLVDASDEHAAERRARSIAEHRFHCNVLVDHAVPCPGFVPNATLSD